MQIDQARPADDDPLIGAIEVKREFGGISDPTLWRWVRDPDLGFPQPLIINRRRYWSQKAVREFRERMARKAA